MKAKTQFERVEYIMSLARRNHLSLRAIACGCKAIFDVSDSEAAISARIRDIKKRGGKVVKRIRAGTRRTWEYKMVRMPK